MRTSHDSDLLELELTRRRIPFVKYGGLRYLEAAHVKDFIALLRLADNHGDEMAWFRVLQLIEGVGPVERGAKATRALDGEDRRSDGRRRASRLPARRSRGVADAVVDALIARARAERAPAPRAERLRDVLAPLVKLRYPDGARADAGPRPARRRRAARRATRGTSSPSSCSTRRSSSADLAQPPHLDEDYLTLSTIHSAKGLEWDSVHVLAVYDGNFPACMSAGTSESIDEERRLLYVGMTRARRTLHLYVPVRYHHRPKGNDDAHGYGKPSRFLTPEVLACCDVKRLPDDPLNPYGAPIVTTRRLTVTPDSLFD